MHGPTEYDAFADIYDVWVETAARHNLEKQTLRTITWTDELDNEGTVLRRKYRRLSFSWLDPEQARALLEETGFEVEAVYGDFDRRPLAKGSPEHIWVARRTAH